MSPRNPLYIFLSLGLALGLFSATAQAQAGSDVAFDGRFNLEQTPLAVVLPIYEQLTDKTLLIPNEVPVQQLPITLKTPEGVVLSEEEAIIALESIMALNGIAVVDMGDRFAKLVIIQSAQQQVPEIIGDDKLNESPSQKVYARFFTIEHLPAEEVVPVVQPYLSTQTQPVLFPKNNAFLVTDSLNNLQRIQKLVDTIDVPLNLNETIQFYPLTSVNAQDLQGRLQALRQGPLQKQLGENTVFEFDERTNQLIVITHKSNLPLIENFIGNLDVDVAPLTKSEVFSIKQAEATTVADLIRQVIEGQRSARDDSDAENPRAPNQPNQPPVPQPQTSAPSQASIDGAALQFSKYVTIVADERSNSIVAYGTSSDLTQIGNLIEQIDVLLALVRIEVVIAEVTLAKDQVRGIDSFNIGIDPNGILGLAGDYEYSVTSASTSRLGAPFSVSGSLEQFSLQTVFDTAKRDSNVRILQNPNITATHNQEAKIVVAESRPVVTSSTSELNNPDSIRSNVSFRDIGIELTVKPLIGSNGMIQMEIDQVVESVIDQVEIDGNEQPVIGKRQATSFVSVADQGVVVLAGLQENTETETNSRIAFFGQLPVLGPLFGGKAQDLNSRELVIFIKPTIIDPAATSAEGEVPVRNKLREEQTRKMVDQYFEQGTFYKEPEPEPVDDEPLRRGQRGK